MLKSMLRVLWIAVILAASLGLALGIGLTLARFGAFGTCQGGTCELVAAIYVMPVLGFILYILALVVFSVAVRNRARGKPARLSRPRRTP
jgi:hypothetical protein